MSTTSSVRKPYVPPAAGATVAQPAPAQPQPASNATQTRPAGNSSSSSSHAAVEPAVTSLGTSAAQPQAVVTRTSSSSSTAAPAAFTALAEYLYAKVPLPLSSRSLYRTFVLSAGVFEVESRFILKELIGQGAYGVVCSALDLKTGRMVAIKKIENVFDHRSLAKRTLRELRIVRALKHENLLGLERVVRPHSSAFTNVYLISELMETDLACVIRSPQELTDEHCQFFIYQVLRGLKFIHSADVIHRDLKPRNLLVNSNCDLKICDFGLARVDDPKHRDRCNMSNYIATRWYRAPEVLSSGNSGDAKKYGKAVDMWSVGCILAELIGRKPIFPGRDSFHQITLICSILGTPEPPASNGSTPAPVPRAPSAAVARLSASSTAAVSDDYIAALPRKAKLPFRTIYPHASALACDLLDKLLVFDPAKRLTVEQALSHPYLDELHCAEDEPSCLTMDFSEHYFEYLKTSKEDLRYLIHDEIEKHYPEERFDPTTPAAQALARAHGLGPAAAKPKSKEPLNSFAGNMAAALPKQPAGGKAVVPAAGAKKVRRKSI